ncbi:hypothetical protein IM793_20975 [Pedobacter sp. MR2016-19]|uniref:hypothetical protein n=1 Tax=Pedobacter sp. MR2016-19 TaxID=2780089 RepID=UPI001876B4E6|nr:hypothetical protein [Pedobacter sp. MR2016-19]MBE5321649.1 hypothetical protein [Pedobacter sp. MR2016-19]
MKNESSRAFGLGLFLAPFIAFILIISLSPGNPSDNEVDKYIKASSEIIIPISKTINLKSTDWTGRFVNGDETSFTNSVRYYLNFRKNRYKEYEVFYSSSFKKYFVIESYNKSMSNLIDQDRKEAQAMVNEQELKNPKYGTLQNPIPILWLTEYEKLSDPINYQKYRYNVVEYLRFYKDRKNYNEGACAVCPY